MIVPDRIRSRWEDWATSRLVGRVVIAVALLLLLISELGHHQLRTLTVEREASVRAQVVVGRLRRSLLFMESATRGFLLTARQDYLQPYRAQLPVFVSTLAEAQALAGDAQQAGGALGRLLPLARRKQAEMQHMIGLFETGDRAAALALLETDNGEHLMTAISELADDVIQQGARNFAEVGELRAQSSTVSRALIWLLVAACVVGAMRVMRLAKARELDRHAHLQAMHTERDRLDNEVALRTAETVALALHMERVREDERARLARELHDELGGLLTAAKLDLARIRKRLPDGSESAQALLVHLSQSLDAGIALKRRIIEDLRPSSLANLGLQATLVIQASEFAQRAEIDVTHDVADVVLPDDQALVVYRIVQEALTNVAKYAQATQVHIHLGTTNQRCEVRVHDNGKGFDPGLGESAGGRGLQGMRFRVQAVGGDLRIRSAPGAGTVVTASLPMSAASPPVAGD